EVLSFPPYSGINVLALNKRQTGKNFLEPSRTIKPFLLLSWGSSEDRLEADEKEHPHGNVVFVQQGWIRG
ncbi:MAG: hypothetical protein ACON5D_08050, partial [Rubripirellula sp.]